MSAMRVFSSRLSRVANLSAPRRTFLSLQTPTRMGLARSRALQQPLAATAPFQAPTKRFYSEGPPPVTPEYAFERISGVLSNCDKVDPAKITPEARLEEDLGLDSLDVVDALFYVEEEFTVQMPDHEADQLHTVKDVVDWVVKQPDSV